MVQATSLWAKPGSEQASLQEKRDELEKARQDLDHVLSLAEEDKLCQAKAESWNAKSEALRRHPPPPPPPCRLVDMLTPQHRAT